MSRLHTWHAQECTNSTCCFTAWVISARNLHIFQALRLFHQGTRSHSASCSTKDSLGTRGGKVGGCLGQACTGPHMRWRGARLQPGSVCSAGAHLCSYPLPGPAGWQLLTACLWLCEHIPTGLLVCEG